MKPAELELAIKKKREEMIKLGMDKGLLCHETINCSQELDSLLNEYNNVLNETKQTNPMEIYHELLLNIHKTIFKSLLRGYSYFFTIP
ncbi:aspartyl-phosphate phosphatase Spo0E family protein [Bacillus sp. 1P10SD]|uniref:aspartyl-phosphate phosphatase Spo0E family protein n=1 Tax=Bacillus sp. 1P10SD TaxID=3132265 RepID=UPI0039A50F5D